MVHVEQYKITVTSNDRKAQNEIWKKGDGENA